MSEHITEDGKILEEAQSVTAERGKTPVEIINAKLEVMKEAHGVGKSGRNDFHKYDYASDYDVLSLVQPAMVKAGLHLEMWPEHVEGPDANGNFRVLFMMQWQHIRGKVSPPLPWYGVAQDRDGKGNAGDKWFNKAATAAEKYFLLKQFHIPAGKDVDPDADAHKQQGGQQAPTKAAKASKVQPQQQEPPPKVEVPSEPGQIPVPNHPNARVRWEYWCKALSDVVSQATTPETVQAWMDANAPALKNLRACGPDDGGVANGDKWADAVQQRAQKRILELQEAPVEGEPEQKESE